MLYDGDQYSDTQKFSINLQYDLNGKENYYTIATETATKGEWKYVGSEFTVPEGATNFYTYVQTGYTSAPKEQDLMNFYMDDAVGEHLPDPAIQDDIASLKDAIPTTLRSAVPVPVRNSHRVPPKTSSKSTTTA